LVNKPTSITVANTIAVRVLVRNFFLSNAKLIDGFKAVPS